MKEIYLLSGLGADKRVFDYLDLEGYKLNYIEWIEPGYAETIESYAGRLLNQISTSKPTVIGVSFGGMMAIEIGKLIPTAKIILISSAKSKSDLPWYYKLVGWLSFHKLIPAKLLKNVNTLTFWFFGVNKDKDKDLLRNIISETDPHFLKWAIGKIVNWGSVTRLNNVVHIHGTKDRILPMRTCDYSIVDGGHLMIIDKAKEVSGVFRNVLL